MLNIGQLNTSKSHAGISLIVLIITIVVIIILAAAVILSLNNNNPISNAKKATYQSDLKGYASDLELYKSNQLLSNPGSFNPDTLEKSTYSGSGDTTGTIKEVFPNMKQEYASVFRIQGGKLLYVGGEQVYVVWLQEIDIPVQMVIIDEASKQIIGVRDFAYIYGTLEIPEYIESIAPNAFYNNQGLVKVDFSKNTKIKEIPARCFSSCINLEEIILPNSLEKIGSSAFENCYKLNDVNVPNSVYLIAYMAFNNCVNLSNFTFPINPEYKIIEPISFAVTKLKNVDIPDSVTTISSNAFSNCSSLVTINIGKQVSQMSAAFDASKKIENINIDKDNPYFSSYDGVIYSKDYSKLIQCPQAKNTINIHNLTKSIEKSSFANCNNLTSINIPNGITTIVNPMFTTCSSLNAISIDSLNSNFLVENNIVYDKGKTKIVAAANTNESIIFPSTLSSIDSHVFSSATKLKSIDMSKTKIENIKSQTFSRCYNLEKIIFPSTLKVISGSAFIYGSKVEELIFPEGLTTIEYNAFYQHANLKTIKLPSTLTNLESAFTRCDKLNDVQISPLNNNFASKDSVIYTKDMRELVCYPLGATTKFVVPSTVKRLRSISISYTSLKELVLPEGLETIDSNTFIYSYSLESITIPSSVTNLGGGAFGDCLALKEIIIKKPEGSIPGAPWAAPYGVLAVKWQP